MRDDIRNRAALAICVMTVVLIGLCFVRWRSAGQRNQPEASGTQPRVTAVHGGQGASQPDLRQRPASPHDAGAPEAGVPTPPVAADDAKGGKSGSSAAEDASSAVSSGNPQAPPGEGRSERRAISWAPAQHAAYRVALQTVGGAAIGYANSSGGQLERVILAARTVPPVRPVPHLKGDIGEAFAERIVTEKFFTETGGWRSITPARIGRAGIDGLFVKLRPDGLVRDVLVVEAKFGTARLQSTAGGRQLSEQWTRTRLRETAAEYGRLARRIRTEGIRYEAGPPAGGSAYRVPLEDGREVLVWEGADGRMYASRTGAGRPAENLSARIVRQLDRIEQHLRAASEGRISFRSRVLQLGREGDAWLIRIRDLTGKTPGVVLKGRFGELPAPVRRGLREALREIFFEQGKPVFEADVLARHVCENPAALELALNGRTHALRYGLDRKTLGLGAAGGAALGAALELGAQWLAGGPIDWRRVGAETAFGAVGGAAAAYAATQATYWTERALARSARLDTRLPLGGVGPVPVRTVLGRVAGTTAGAAVFAAVVPTLQWAFGFIDETTWQRSVVAGVGGSLIGGAAGSAAVALVSTYGVASTGTAIATLSGAAAQSATLAWFGGGSLAAGGLGVAGGGAVLTGGVLVVAVAATYGIMKVFEALDEAAQRRIMTARIQMLTERAREDYAGAIRPKATSRNGGQPTPAVLGTVP